MALAAGQRLTADLLNQYLVTAVGNAPFTANSGAVGSTETQISTVSGNLISGMLYTVLFVGRATVSTSGTPTFRIREDNSTGTQQGINFPVITSIAGNGNPVVVMAQYTATATASKTFSLTSQLAAGTVTTLGSASSPGFFTITLNPQ